MLGKINHNMRTLVHISDLHFGKFDSQIIKPLQKSIRDINPDLLIISGDITDRGRSSQFRRAREFLNSLPARKFIVPGNHDVPLYKRFILVGKPLKRFQKFISSDLEPFYSDDEIAVLGINTTKVVALTGNGRIGEEHLASIQERFLNMEGPRVKILVTHHPFDLPSQPIRHGLVRGAKRAMNTLKDCGVDMLLAGHLHVSHIGSTGERFNTRNYSALALGAGSVGTLHGLKGPTSLISGVLNGAPEAYSFNVITINQPRLAITPFTWDGSGQFVASPRLVYKKIPIAGWRKDLLGLAV